MAKHKASRSTALAIKHALARRAPIVKPIIVKPAAVVVKKTKRHGKHRGGGRGMLGGFLSGNRMGIALGALGVGFLEKSNMLASLPGLPIVGKKGTIALGAYLLSDGGRNKLADDICTAALVLAAEEFGRTGSVSGSTDGYVAGGVDYVAGF